MRGVSLLAYGALVSALLFVFEAFSTGENMVLEPCVIIRSQKVDSIFMDANTLVEFDDGFRSFQRNDLGEAGARILGYRQRGSVSVSGITGTISYREKARRDAERIEKHK